MRRFQPPPLQGLFLQRHLSAGAAFWDNAFPKRVVAVGVPDRQQTEARSALRAKEGRLRPNEGDGCSSQVKVCVCVGGTLWRINSHCLWKKGRGEELLLLGLEEPILTCNRWQEGPPLSFFPFFSLPVPWESRWGMWKSCGDPVRGVPP